MPRVAWLRTVGVTASHVAKCFLLVFCDAYHSLALPSSPAGRGRARPSRTSDASENLSRQRKKDTIWCPFRWRRRRDLGTQACAEKGANLFVWFVRPPWRNCRRRQFAELCIITFSRNNKGVTTRVTPLLFGGEGEI